MSRPEEEGIHVHAWDLNGDMVIDETYSPVEVDGHLIEEVSLRLLAAQRALADGAPIVSKDCGNCGEGLSSPVTEWLEPVTKHLCSHCGERTSTRLRSFVNPLVGLFDGK